MDYSFTDTELELARTYRRFFEANCGTDVVRASEPLGYDKALWERLLYMDAVGMSVGSLDGSEDASIQQLALIAHQCGRYLAPVPFVAATASARLLRDYVHLLPQEWVDTLKSGLPIITLALRPVRDGVTRLVPEGAIAGAFVSMAAGSLVLSSSTAERYSPVNLGSSPLADCRPGADSIVLSEGQSAREAYSRAVRDWKLLTASSLVGLAERAMEIALEYVKQRRAFNVLVASFQTVQHRLADDRVALDGAQFLCSKAAWAIDEGREDANVLANMAYHNAAEVGERVAADSLHFHGGIGYTLECDIQLFFRRAKAWPLTLGDPDRILLEIADLLYGATPEA